MNNDHKAPGTKERLFKAAIRVFAEKGYENATVREICGLAEANVAAVNYHFGDKESLYFQVVEEIFRSSRNTRTPYLSQGAPVEARLKIFIRSNFEEILPGAYPDKELTECMDMGTIFMMEIARPTGALDRIVENYIRQDGDELKAILKVFLGSDAPQRIIEMCTASVIGQILHFYYSAPIIQRLAPDGGAFLLDPEFLDYATEHVFAFSLGGLERFKTTLEGQRS